MAEFIDYYEVLQVHPAAEPEVIEKSYKALIFKYHPDRGGDSDRCALLNEAYEVLGDASRRMEYNLRWGAAKGTVEVEPTVSGPNPDEVVDIVRRVALTQSLMRDAVADAGVRQLKVYAAARVNPGATIVGALLGGVRGAVREQNELLRQKLHHEHGVWTTYWWEKYQAIWAGATSLPAEGRLTRSDLWKLERFAPPVQRAKFPE